MYLIGNEGEVFGKSSFKNEFQNRLCNVPVWLANVYYHSAVTSDEIESAKGIACVIVSLCLEYLEKLPRLNCTKLTLLPLCFLVFCVHCCAHLQKARTVFS